MSGPTGGPSSPGARPGFAPGTLRRNLTRVAAGARRLAAVLGGVVVGTVVWTGAGLFLLVLAITTLGDPPAWMGGVIVVALVMCPVVGAVWGGVRIGRRFRSGVPRFQCGRPPSGATRESAVACPNCGAERSGTFCAGCGQNDRDYRRLFPALSGVLVETFEADSRLRRTLPALFLRPGFLTLEFIRDRRAGYVSPFRLYVFASLLYFVAASWLGGMYEEGAREYLEFAPVLLLCAIPFYAAVLQFVFIGSHFYAAHLVFTLHLLAVALLVMIPFIPWMYGQTVGWRYFAFMVPVGVYLFIALRRVYGTGPLATLGGWVAMMVQLVGLYFVVVGGSEIMASLSSGQDWRVALWSDA